MGVGAGTVAGSGLANRSARAMWTWTSSPSTRATIGSAVGSEISTVYHRSPTLTRSVVVIGSLLQERDEYAGDDGRADDASYVGAHRMGQ